MVKAEAGVSGGQAAAALHVARGAETRQRVLEVAFALATREGLEGLTIGKLAEATQLSKAGLFAHFGSKELLQIATVEHAREVFIAEVVRPGLQAERGLGRLMALCRHWLDYSLAIEGGCFFAAASMEFDSRPGPIKARIADVMREWLACLERAVIEAGKAGHVEHGVDAVQVAFELNALVMASNWARQLFADGRAAARTEHAVVERLRLIATDDGLRALTPMRRRR